MFNISFSAPSSFLATFDAPGDMTAAFENTVVVPVGEYYTGEYVVTPAETEQVLLTNGLIAAHNIVINPIPSNYGKINWNGAVLTVS